MNSSFMEARETPFSPYVAPRFAHMSEMDSSLRQLNPSHFECVLRACDKERRWQEARKSHPTLVPTHVTLPILS